MLLYQFHEFDSQGFLKNLISYHAKDEVNTAQSSTYILKICKYLHDMSKYITLLKIMYLSIIDKFLQVKEL